MNAFYDRTQARTDVQNLFTQGMDTGEDLPLLSDIEIAKYGLYHRADPPFWRLIERGTEGTESEEALFRLPGILVDADLPPVRIDVGRSLRKSSDYLGLKQSATVCGLGGPKFADAVRASQDIVAVFQRASLNNELVTERDAVFESYSTIRGFNRYFTERRAAPDLRCLPFRPGVDPQQLLQDFDPKEIIHCDENVVQYTVLVKKDGQKSRHDSVHPARFRTGDIVEMLIGFTAVKIKHDRLKLLPTMRGLCLISSELREKSLKRKAGTQDTDMPVRSKRRYLNDNADELVEKFDAAKCD